MMRSFRYTAFILILASAPTWADPIVLAKKGDMPAAGVTREIKIAVSHDNILGAAMIDGKAMELRGNRKDATEERLEGLGGGKMRRLLVSLEAQGEIIINGEKTEPPARIDPFIDAPLIVTYAGGKWSADFEKGAPLNLPPKFGDTFAEGLNGEVAIKLFGDIPRKPGDQWKGDSAILDPALFGEFNVSMKEVKGSFSVEFVEVKEHKGVPCAVLDITFEMESLPSKQAKSPEPVAKVKGGGRLYRAVEDRVNLEWQFKGKMDMVDPPEAKTGNKIALDFTIDGRTTVTKK